MEAQTGETGQTPTAREHALLERFGDLDSGLQFLIVAEASTGSATIHAHSPNNPPNNPRSARRVPCPTDTLPSAERPSRAVVIRERLMCWSVRCRAAGALHVRSCDMTVEVHAALRDLATCNAMRRWACAILNNMYPPPIRKLRAASQTDVLSWHA